MCVDDYLGTYMQDVRIWQVRAGPNLRVEANFFVLCIEAKASLACRSTVRFHHAKEHIPCGRVVNLQMPNGLLVRFPGAAEK